MKKYRQLLAIPLFTILAGGSLLLTSGPARADSEPGGNKQPTQAAMVRYAIEQSKILYANLDGKTTDLSPRDCKEGDGRDVLYLPANFNGTTDVTINCRAERGQALILDLGGIVGTEDPEFRAPGPPPLPCDGFLPRAR